MRLLNKIFGNRDDPEAAAGEGSDDSSHDRETIELEPYDPSAEDESRTAPEQSGRLTFAPPASVAAGDGSEEKPHELTRRRIARPLVASPDEPPTPPPIPVAAFEADDPEEIDVSDQLDEVNDDADLDASQDLIIEDDAPLAGEDAVADEEEEETSISVTLWRDAAAGLPPASGPGAAPAPEPSPLLDPTPPGPARHEPAAQSSAETAAEGSSSLAADETQPDPEWTMGPDTNKPKQTLVEAGTEFRGTLKSSCPVLVNGTLDGDIEAPALSIARTGSIQGNIRVETLRSSGTLAGNVDAGEVYVSGAVRSKTVIRAKRLELALGSSGKGHVEVTLTSSELVQSDAEPSAAEASGAPSGVTTSDSEASGSAGWDLPEGESSVEPARARASSKRTTAK